MFVRTHDKKQTGLLTSVTKPRYVTPRVKRNVAQARRDKYAKKPKLKEPPWNDK